MSKKKTQYYYVAGLYNVDKGNGELGTLNTSFMCTTESDINPSGISTQGRMLASVKKYAQSKGYTYIDGTFIIMSIIKLTKEQFDALNDLKEPEDEEA